jgi:hypothetical protein
VRKGFASRISAQPLRNGSLDSLCYTAQSMAGVEVPTLKLVFEGTGAAMELRSGRTTTSSGSTTADVTSSA